jgi:NAD(P)-dependent dehydrogenase (short-subunit alcohol dehydrogenase family)
MAASPIRFSNYNFDDKPTAEEDILDLGPLKTLLGIGQLGPGGYDASIAYGQSKTANTLFAVQLNTLLASKGIFAFSVNPGIVYSTGSKKVYDTFDDKQRKDLAAFGIMKTIDQGSATTIVAALDPGLTPEAGTYLVNCQIADAMAPAYATSKEMAERLWKLSENLVGEIVRI